MILGLAFMLVFSGFQTMGNVQPIILDSAKDNSSEGFVKDFNGNGLTSMAIVNAVFTFANLIVPPILSIIGPKLTLVGNLST